VIKLDKGGLEKERKKRERYNRNRRRGVRKSCKIIYVYIFNRLVNACGAYYCIRAVVRFPTRSINGIVVYAACSNILL
jgi:hypothetical protein